MSSRRFLVLADFCFAALYLLAVPAFLPGDDDAHFIDGLRQRRLFSLAEDFCRSRLDDNTLTETQRVELVVDLIRCLALDAAHAPPADRPEVWSEARRTAADFQRKYPQTARLILVRVQDALTLLARGELLRVESELRPDSERRAEEAKAVLREASGALEAVAAHTRREIPLRHRRSETPGELSVEELIALQHQIRYHQSRAARNRALCYPADSEDRIAMLTQAVDILNQALTQIAADETLAARMRIDLATCHRLLADFSRAEQALTVVFRIDPGPELLLEARAEVVRLELARKRLERAVQQIEAGRGVQMPASAQFDMACLEASLAMWSELRSQGDEVRADGWRDQSVDLVKRIEQLHGPYWGRRADRLLINAAGKSSGAGNVELLTRTADNLYRTGQLDEAISAYDKAAEATDDTQQAFELRYKAALIEHSRRNHRAAAEKLRGLSLDMPEHDRAADVHLLAAWNAAQDVKTEPATASRYEEILTEHLGNWPARPTADTARLWLGRLQESRGQLKVAAATYQAISRDARHYEEALPAAARCLSGQLELLQNTPDTEEDSGELARSAALHFETQIRELLQDGPQPWTPLDRFCAEQAARFWLQTNPPRANEAEAVLTAALGGEPAPDTQWRATAQSLLVVALAGQSGKRNQAEQILQESGEAAPKQLLEILSAVSAISRSASAASRQELAALQLAVTDRMAEHRSELDRDTRRSLDRIRAESLLLADRRAAALEAYRQLAEDYPDDGSVQEAYGDLLLSVGDAASLRQALQQWRRIAARSRPHDDRWYRAKHAVVTALIELGQNQEAADRVRYLLGVPPGVQDPAWKAKFEALLQRYE